MQTTDTKYNYLNLIPYTLFELWDTKRYTSKKIASSFNVVALGSCIKEENKKEKLFEQEDEEFGILGVNNKGGIFDAYTQKGKEINQVYKKMEVDWLAYNPYRINVGSIGIKKSEHKNDYISPAYVVFSCNEKLLPEFLFLIFKTETFNKVINESTTGSVRQNLTIDILKTLQIPLPSLKEQKTLVKNYFDKIAEAKRLSKQASDLEGEIEKYLNEALGIQYEEKKKQKGLYFIDFSKIQRWDLWNANVHQNTSSFEIVKISSLIKLKSGNFLPASKMIAGDYNVYGGNGISGTHNEYFLEGKRLVIGRVGEYCGNVHLIEGSYWITDNAFIVDKISENVTYEYLQVGLAHLNLNKYRAISAQPSISQKAILDLDFPLPLLSKQQEIVAHIQEQKEKIKQLQIKEEQLKQQAKQEFEKAIFS